MKKIEKKYSWIMEAKIKDAILGEDGLMIWYDGTWERGKMGRGKEIELNSQEEFETIDYLKP